jgi:hypothetical protein
MKGEVIFGGATVYGPMWIRQVIIEMYSAGADPDLVPPMFSQSVHIHDQAPSTTVFAVGLAASQEPDDTLRLISLADDFGVNPANHLAVRIVHTCPNLDALAVDFGDDGSIEATVERFSGNTEGYLALAADTTLTMVVQDAGTTTVVDVFTTPAMPADNDTYLILTGIKDGSPGFALLTVNEDGPQGFTAPN